MNIWDLCCVACWHLSSADNLTFKMHTHDISINMYAIYIIDILRKTRLMLEKIKSSVRSERQSVRVVCFQHLTYVDVVSRKCKLKAKLNIKLISVENSSSLDDSQELCNDSRCNVYVRSLIRLRYGVHKIKWIRRSFHFVFKRSSARN